MAVEIDGTSKGLIGAFALFGLGSGIVTLVYGVFLLLRNATIEYNFGVFNLFTTSILLIVVGSLVILVVILGVIGAFTDTSNLRLAALVLLFVSFGILAAVGTWAMLSYKTGRVQNSVNNDMNFLNATVYNDLAPDLKAKADYLHKTYNCCGFSGTYDIRANEYGQPESCCIVKGCSTNPRPNEQDYFSQGCALVYFGTKVTAVFHVAILALVAAGLALIALILYGIVSQRARGGYAAVSRG